MMKEEKDLSEKKDELEEIEDSDALDPDGEYFDDDFFDEEPVVKAKKKQEPKPARESDPREKDVEIQTRDLPELPNPWEAKKKTSTVTIKDSEEKKSHG